MENKKIYGYTDYKTAARWLHGDLILCNDIPEIDPTIWDNMEFNLEDEDGDCIEIYQWYLTNYTHEEMAFLIRTFGLLFTYSEKLDLYILCVDHCGTAWEGVAAAVYSSEWWEFNGKKYKYKY